MLKLRPNWGPSVGTKLLALIMATLLLAVGAVVSNATFLFKKDNLNSIYVTSEMLTAAKAGEIRAWLQAQIQKGTLVGRALVSKKTAPVTSERLLATFAHDGELVSVGVFERGQEGFNPGFAERHTWVREAPDAKRAAQTVSDGALPSSPDRYTRVAAGITHVQSRVAPDGKALLVLDVPFVKESEGVFSSFVSIVVRQERLLESFADTGAYTLALLDGTGMVLAHPDSARIKERKSLKDVPIVKRMLASSLEREFQEYAVGGEAFLGAFAKVGLGDLGVVSQVPRSRAFEAGVTLVRRSVLIATLTLSVSFILAYFLAQTLISPIRKLSLAAQEIGKGNFKLRVETRTRDEIATLAGSFNVMSAEIERLMQATADKARMEKELETAKHVQDTMFPPSRLELPSLEVLSYYTPASECGGDWWGAYELPDSKVLLAIGDATGHGVPAAMVTATAKAVCTMIHLLSKQLPALASDPGAMLAFLNKTILDSTGGNIMMTFLLAVLDTRSGEVVYSSASHNPPYWYKMPAEPGPEGGSKSDLDVLMPDPGNHLGKDPDSTFQNCHARIGPNDLLVLYTDGLTEGQNAASEEYGTRRFSKAIFKNAHKPTESVRDAMLEDFRKFVAEEPLHDDVTLVVCRFNPARRQDSAA